MDINNRYNTISAYYGYYYIICMSITMILIDIIKKHLVEDTI